MKTLLPLLFLVLALTVRGADPVGGDFTGHYELARTVAGSHGRWFFFLDVEQKGKNARLTYSAGNEDGSGAAPDGSGKGTLNADGTLEFKWDDSFENAGIGVLSRNGKLYHLLMKTSKLGEGRGAPPDDLTLKRTSPKPQMSTR